MSTGALDPLIHDPERLRIVATLAALRDGDTLTVTRLQDMTGLPPGSPVTCLRELGHAGYVRTEMTGGRAQAAVALTCQGRAALDRYTAMLRHLPQAARQDHQAPAPGVRAGDADRDAAAAAMGEHFAQGRLTLVAPLDHLHRQPQVLPAGSVPQRLARRNRDASRLRHTAIRQA
jgi:Domain of unknown function (DUF1707)